MLLYCSKCRKNTESESKSCKVKKRRNIFFLSKCAVRDSKKLKFVKEQEVSELLSSLGIKTPFKQNSFISSSFVLEVLTS